MSTIAKVLNASDETPREILRAVLPAVLVTGSCAFVLACLHVMHVSGAM